MKREIFFPKMINDMGLKIGVEIGVGQGNHSKNILENTNIYMFCIDSYPDNSYGADSGDDRYREAKTNLDFYIQHNRANLIRSDSVNFLRNYPDKHFDFCYIDGDHTYNGVKTDVELWFPKLKDGGLFCGHDYKKRKGFGVKQYIDEFALIHGYVVNIVDRMNWWLVK